MQTVREREMAEMIGGELHFVSAVRQCQILDGHHAGVVDQDVQRPAPFCGEGGDAGQVAEVQRADGDRVVPGVRADVPADPFTGGDVPHRKRDGRSRIGERARRLDTDAGRAAGHDRALTTEIDARNDVGGRR
jgi:hypothetical protein